MLPARAWRRRPFRGQMILPLGVAAFRAKRSPAPNFMGYVVSYFFCSFIPKVQHLVDKIIVMFMLLKSSEENEGGGVNPAEWVVR